MSRVLGYLSPTRFNLEQTNLGWYYVWGVGRGVILGVGHVPLPRQAFALRFGTYVRPRGMTHSNQFVHDQTR